MAITKPVIIAGAGPVGCVAALRLVQAGIPIVLLEGAATLPQTLRASTFHPPTVDMMDELGITAELEAQGLICRYYQYRDRRTGEIAEFDLDVLRNDTKHPYRLQVEQYKLTQLIWKILERDYAHLSKCLLNHMVKGVYQTADGVEVLAWEGMTERLFEGSFVLACDGSDSAVRKAMAIPFEGFTYP